MRWPLGKTSRTFGGDSGGETAGGERRKRQFIKSGEKTLVWRFLRRSNHESPCDPHNPTPRRAPDVSKTGAPDAHVSTRSGTGHGGGPEAGTTPASTKANGEIKHGPAAGRDWYFATKKEWG